MEHAILSTPFGRRSVSYAQISGQLTAKLHSKTAPIDKWQVFRSLREARNTLNLSDRSLAILNALLSFHPTKELIAGSNLIVFPSNNQLIDRANGISLATLKRHLAILVQRGIIIRRDSPNGKRYTRRRSDGTLVYAFGFDLSPLAARAEEFECLAKDIIRQRETLQQIREQISLSRRHILKLITFALSESFSGEWERFKQKYQLAIDELPRAKKYTDYERIMSSLTSLLQEVTIIFKEQQNLHSMSCNEAHNEPHIEESKPEIYTKRKKGKTTINLTTEFPKFNSLMLQNDIKLSKDLPYATEIAAKLMAIPITELNKIRSIMGNTNLALAIAALYEGADNVQSPPAFLNQIKLKYTQGNFNPIEIKKIVMSQTNEPTKISEPDIENKSTQTEILTISNQLKRLLN